MSLSCSDCGAIVDGLKCGNCGKTVGVENYGFRLGKGSGGYLLYEGKDPVLSFGSLGSNTQKKIAEKTGVPINVVELAFAKLANMKPHAEKTDNEEEEILVKYLPSITTDEFIAEQVWDGKTAPQYAIRRFDEDKITYGYEVNLGESDDKGREIIYRPVYNDHLLTGMITTPQKPIETNFEEIIAESFDYLGQTDFFDPCGKMEQVRLIGMIVMGSWFLDRMIPKTSIPVAGFGRFAPIIPIRGPSESGKNRLANLLRFLSYRPFFQESTSRIPSVVRPLDMWKGTLIWDEADFYKSGAQTSLAHFLNCRATGSPSARQNPDKVSVSQVFESFGITVLTQRQHFDDNALESRSVPFYTEKTSHKIPTIELDEVVEWGLQLQNKLLFLRLMYWNQFVIDKRYWIAGLTDHRLNAALLPTVSLSKFEPKITKIIEKCAAPIQLAKRRVKAESSDGRVVNILWDKIQDGKWTEKQTYYVVLDENDVITENEVERQIQRALLRSHIKEQIGLDYKDIKKVLNSLNLAPEDAPERLYIGKRRSRVILFRPVQMEKQLREFVVKYEPNSLYKVLNVEIPLNDYGTDGTDGTAPMCEDPPRDIYSFIEGEEPEEDLPPEPTTNKEKLSLHDENSIVKSLVKYIQEEKEVGELVPLIYLRENGIHEKDAKNIIEGIRQSGAITQNEKTKSWTAPRRKDA